MLASKPMRAMTGSMSDLPDPPTTSVDRMPRGPLFADPLLRALAIFAAGMALLLAIDLASEPTGRVGQDRAIDSALSASNGALAAVTDSDIPIDEEAPREAQRRERAQSTAFFLEQANLAWRRGDTRTPQALETERGSAALLLFLGKLWVIGWLLLPLGALASRLACPRLEGRHPHWTLNYAATSLGGTAGLTALALAIYALGAPAPFVVAPLVTAIVVLNAWLLRDHAKLDPASTLLRLAPLLIILAVTLVLAREALLQLAVLP